MSVAVYEDDDIFEDNDIFKDALPEFASLSDAACGTTGQNVGHARFESAEALIQEQDLVIGRGISGEIFYEAEGGDYKDFVSVVFSTRSPSSNDYNGTDTQVFDLRIT